VKAATVTASLPASKPSVSFSSFPFHGERHALVDYSIGFQKKWKPRQSGFVLREMKARRDGSII
jgi:hypothetical protein